MCLENYEKRRTPSKHAWERQRSRGRASAAKQLPFCLKKVRTSQGCGSVEEADAPKHRPSIHPRPPDSVPLDPDTMKFCVGSEGVTIQVTHPLWPFSVAHCVTWTLALESILEFEVYGHPCFSRAFLRAILSLWRHAINSGLSSVKINLRFICACLCGDKRCRSSSAIAEFSRQVLQISSTEAYETHSACHLSTWRP